MSILCVINHNEICEYLGLVHCVNPDKKVDIFSQFSSCKHIFVTFVYFFVKSSVVFCKVIVLQISPIWLISVGNISQKKGSNNILQLGIKNVVWFLFIKAWSHCSAFYWLNERVRILHGVIQPIECVLFASWSLSFSLSLQWDRVFTLMCIKHCILNVICPWILFIELGGKYRVYSA